MVTSGKIMDNLGFRDSANYRKLKRSVSFNEEVESFPLNKTSVKWRQPSFEEDVEACISEGCEYLECGHSPPADYIPLIFENLDEFTRTERAVQICQDTIKSNLLEHMKLSSGRQHLLSDVETKKLAPDNVEQTLKGATKFEINIVFLYAAFMKRWELLDDLIKLGAQLQYYEPSQGLSALHLAAFSGCIPGTQFLLAQGCDPNAIFKYYAPLHCSAFGDSAETAMVLLNSGAKVQALTNGPDKCQESVLHCAVRANAIACVGLLTVEGADVGQVEFTIKSPIHLAAELGHPQCLKIMLELDKVNVNAKTKDKLMTPLHFAAEKGSSECVEILINKGADCNLRNYRGQTCLHLAVKSQSLDCVEMLLFKGNANPSVSDHEKRIPLHTAVSNSGRCFDIIEILVNTHSNVNAREQYGYTPLHLAALNELSEGVEVLINNGADVTAKSRYGVTALGIITKKTPAALAMIKDKLDSAITLHQYPASSNKEVELHFDFQHILQNSANPGEITVLNTFVDEGQKELLLHPLCSAFLYLKWEKIRKYYIARIVFSFVFILSLSLYILSALAHNCYNLEKNRNNVEQVDDIELCEKESALGRVLRTSPFVVEMQWFVLVAITCCEILRKVYGVSGYTNARQYLSHPENIIEWIVIISVFVISFIYTGRTHHWQNHVGAFAVLFGWTNLMLMIGQLPIFGPYVAMYTKVQREFAKLLLAYSCLLIGFAISFCVIFPDTSSFGNPFIALITVLVMMTGEVSLDLLVKADILDENHHPYLLEISAQVTFVLFLLFVTVILMNLLVGIAVHDIQGLQKTAGLSKLVRQTKLISNLELALFTGYLPDYFLTLLHWTALVATGDSSVVLNTKPLNPLEKRLPKEILQAAYEIAKSKKHHGETNLLDAAISCEKLTDFALERKIDGAMQQIEVLTSEVKGLKSGISAELSDFKVVLEKQQMVIEQLMKIVTQRNTSD